MTQPRNASRVVHGQSSRRGALEYGQSASESEPLLSVTGLCKRFPTFELADVEFSVNAGSIVGFIGRNGSGKTTTIKCIMGAEHPTSGEVCYFGMPFLGNEAECKQRIGVVLGAASYYTTKRLSAIASTVRAFYPSWDDKVYEHYLREFDLDPHKKVRELSQGMRVKFALALALSHQAQLLILDEPTSGLDPLSREELLDIFLALANRGCGILFSTQITTDLDKCADSFVYIKQGRLRAAGSLDEYRAGFRVADLEEARRCGARVLGVRRSAHGSTALVSADSGLGRAATLEDIMVHENGGDVL